MWGDGDILYTVSDHDNPEASVDDWMRSVYHRVLLLVPRAHYMGYGNGEGTDHRVDVIDLANGPFLASPSSTAAYPLSYPADGQVGVPVSWGGNEIPDPLPPRAPRPGRQRV